MYDFRVRTTVTLDDDVAAAVDRLRRGEHLGLSEAVNTLIRRGLTRRADDDRPSYRHRSRSMGMLIDVANVEEALDLAEGANRR